MTNIGQGRLLRVCDLCGDVDDHPRHVLTGGLPDVYPTPSVDLINKVLGNASEDDRARLVRDLVDTSSSDRHMDCCRTAGCPTGACDEVAEDLRGADLLDHLTSLADLEV